MKNSQIRRLVGLGYIIAGLILMIWASAILIRVLVFIVSLMLINTGLKMRGNPGLMTYGMRIWYQRHHYF